MLIIGDGIAFLFSILGVTLAVALILKALFPSERPGYDVDLLNSIHQWISSSYDEGERTRLLLEDYKTATDELGRRDNIVLLGGTILITSSLLLLAEFTKEGKSVPVAAYAGVSIGLFSIWLLLLHETAKKLDDIAYDRIKAIEMALSEERYKFGIHRYTHEKTEEQSAWWLLLRRTFWYFVLLLLCLTWLVLSI